MEFRLLPRACDGKHTDGVTRVSAIAVVIGVVGLLLVSALSSGASVPVAQPPSPVGTSRAVADVAYPDAGDPRERRRSRERPSPAAKKTVRPKPSATPAAPKVVAASLASNGIPSVALHAYRRAAAAANRKDARCRLPWPLLAAIGRVESNHGRFAGATVYTDGTSAPRIIGIPLTGNGTAVIRDSDDGRLDGDTVYDRAVGPMQFIPETWARFAVDANGDRRTDPFNLFDAAAAAGDYLCVAGGDLATSRGQVRAVFAYNNSHEYVATVLALEAVYARGAGVVVPTAPAIVPKPTTKPTVPPVNPAPPPALATPPPTKSLPPPSPTASAAGSDTAPATTASTTSPAAESTAPAPELTPTEPATSEPATPTETSAPSSETPVPDPTGSPTP